MRSILISAASLMLLASGAAQAAVSISVDKNTQQMTVAVDGVTRYNWPVSSGNPSHETPNGSFRTFRMEEDHYSKEFDDAPMPHSIFFTKQGHAIHGTDSVNRLGSPASHGCVRLSRANASTLWNLVKAEGLLNTTVTLTGSSQVALARNPRSNAVATARNPSPSADADAQPMQIAPQERAATYDPNDPYGYAAQSYRERTSSGGADQPWPVQQQRRVYVDPRTGQRYSAQDEYADQNAGYVRPRSYIIPRGGY